MRVAVIGAAGLLGRHLCEEAAALGHEVDALGRADCDLARPSAEVETSLFQRFSLMRPDVVFTTAAYTDVDGSEREPDRAFSVNALGAEAVARAATELAIHVVHISTDFVFKGDAERPYDEFDAPAPESVYARSKRAGEELVLRAQPTAAVVRVGGLYGRGGRNFFSTMVERLERAQALTIDAERRVAPTWVRPLARQLIAIASDGAPGFHHATCAGETTWHGFAERLRELAAGLGMNLAHSYQAVATAELKAPAKRPRCSLLDCRMLRLRGLYTMPSWDEALLGYLTELAGQRSRESGD